MFKKIKTEWILYEKYKKANLQSSDKVEILCIEEDIKYIQLEKLHRKLFIKEAFFDLFTIASFYFSLFSSTVLVKNVYKAILPESFFILFLFLILSLTVRKALFFSELKSGIKLFLFTSSLLINIFLCFNFSALIKAIYGWN